MINREGLLVLSNYNNYANQLMLDTAAKLTEEQFTKDFEVSLGSVQKTIQHMYEGEQYFLCLYQGKPFEEGEPPVLAELSGYWGDAGEMYLAFIAGKTDDDLRGEIDVQFGEYGFHIPLWQLLTQNLLHSMIHRGELSVFLTQHGHPLPTMDILIPFIKDSGQEWPFG